MMTVTAEGLLKGLPCGRVLGHGESCCEGYLCGSCETLKNAADTLTYLQSQIISGFYEEEFPQFKQGAPTHELEGVVTAEEVSHYIIRIQKLEEQNKELKETLNWLETHVFERKWDGTIGRAPYWITAGPYRHALQKMRGNTLKEAVKMASKEYP